MADRCFPKRALISFSRYRVNNGCSITCTKVSAQGMGRIEFDNEFRDIIKAKADKQATELSRGKANIEDDLRVAIELYKGLLIQGDEKADKLKTDLDNKLLDFIKKF